MKARIDWAWGVIESKSIRSCFSISNSIQCEREGANGIELAFLSAFLTSITFCSSIVFVYCRPTPELFVSCRSGYVCRTCYLPHGSLPDVNLDSYDKHSWQNWTVQHAQTSSFRTIGEHAPAAEYTILIKCRVQNTQTSNDKLSSCQDQSWNGRVLKKQHHPSAYAQRQICPRVSNGTYVINTHGQIWHVRARKHYISTSCWWPPARWFLCDAQGTGIETPKADLAQTWRPHKGPEQVTHS